MPKVGSTPIREDRRSLHGGDGGPGDRLYRPGPGDRRHRVRLFCPQDGDRADDRNIYLGRATFYTEQIIGNFGWSDAAAPFLVVLAFGFAIVGLAWLALATAKRRHSAVFVGLLGASLVIPIAIDVRNTLQIHNDVRQSRYAMPLYVGVPLVAAATAGRAKAIKPTLVRLLTVVVAAIVAASQLACFYTPLRRDAIGSGGAISLFLHAPGSWSPPIPAALCVVAAAVLAAAYGLLIARLGHLAPAGDSAGRHAEGGTGQRALEQVGRH